MPDQKPQSLPRSEIPLGIKTDIQDFLEEFILKYPARPIRGGKIIHDTLWGTVALKRHEIALIDTPLLQRLRQIHQTSLSSLTYPSSGHTRFEHTLGVLSQTDKLLDSLSSQPEYEGIFGTEIKANLRLAALLHDCGHGPLSHTSEEIYRFCDDMQTLIGAGGFYEGKNPHEVLGHLIVTHPIFQDYLKALKKDYGFECDSQKIADAILGKAEEDKKYTVQILNGPFDADKIDYVFRDGHSTGLPLRIDLDRLWYCIKVDWLDKKRILVANYSGISPLEQILFCKIILFSTIYHHHKVRATDCMFKAVIEYMRNHSLPFGRKKLRLSKATDFLWLTDNTFFAEALMTNDEHLHKMIHNILYRRLFQRALIIRPDTIEEEAQGLNYKEFQDLSQKKVYNQKKKIEIAEKIWEASGRLCHKEEIWLDVPPFPPTNETDETFIKYSSELKKMSKIFPVHEWVEMFVDHKWRAHVFCPWQCQKKVSEAARDVLEKEYGFKFKNSAWLDCHIES